jgi:hypothetical protein
VKILRTSFWSEISCAHAPGYGLTFISFALFDLSNRRFSKNRSLPAVLFWQISATICVCLLISFFLSSFDHGTFEEVATVAYALMGVILELKLNQKGGFTILFVLMLLIRKGCYYPTVVQMISGGWIISHRCSWITVYVLCCNIQVNLIVILMTCTCIVCILYSINFSTVICLPSMLFIFMERHL